MNQVKKTEYISTRNSIIKFLFLWAYAFLKLSRIYFYVDFSLTVQMNRSYLNTRAVVKKSQHTHDFLLFPTIFLKKLIFSFEYSSLLPIITYL